MKTTILLLLALLLITTPALANRSGDVHLHFYAGGFSPQSYVLDETYDGFTFARGKLGEKLGYGGGLTIWLNENLGLAGTGYYVATSLDGELLGQQGRLDATVFNVGGRVVLGLGGGQGPSVFNLSAGLVANSTNIDQVERDTITAGVIGAELNIPVGSRAALRFAADDYIYDLFWTVDGFQTDPIRQHDLVLSAGITIFTGN